MKQNFTVRQGALDGVEAFLSVAEHRSFRKAAAELGVTPSAMSQAVRALEARLGTALFIRTTRSVGLTEAGERFHACLRMRRSNGSIAPWPFADGNKAIEAIVSGPLIAHDYPTLLGAAIQGLGLAQLPGPLAKAPIADGQLEALLAPFAVTTPGVFLYYPDRRHVSPKLRAFIEHAKYRSAAAPYDATTARKSRKLNRANSS